MAFRMCPVFIVIAGLHIDLTILNNFFCISNGNLKFFILQIFDCHLVGCYVDYVCYVDCIGRYLESRQAHMDATYVAVVVCFFAFLVLLLLQTV